MHGRVCTDERWRTSLCGRNLHLLWGWDRDGWAGCTRPPSARRTSYIRYGCFYFSLLMVMKVTMLLRPGPPQLGGTRKTRYRSSLSGWTRWPSPELRTICRRTSTITAVLLYQNSFIHSFCKKQLCQLKERNCTIKLENWLKYNYWW